MPRGKGGGQKEELFLSEEGCRKAARLYIDECDRLSSGQSEFVSKIGLSESTGTKYKYLLNGLATYRPDPTTAMLFGSVTTDPETGKPFDPWKYLLGICCALSGDRLIDIALLIDPNCLEMRQRTTTLRDVDRWLEDAPEDQVALLRDRLCADLKAKEVEYEEFSDACKSEHGAIAEIIQGVLDSFELKPHQFAKYCGLKTEQIRSILSGEIPQQPETLAEGLAAGLNNLMGQGWNAAIVRRIDPSRFSARQQSLL